MASESKTSETEASSNGAGFSLFGNTDWLKPFPLSTPSNRMKAYVAAWQEVLGVAAARLPEQADYVKNLSECKDPADALTQSVEFSWLSLASRRQTGRDYSAPFPTHFTTSRIYRRRLSDDGESKAPSDERSACRPATVESAFF